jgi:phosphate/sulfate permease
MILGFMAASYSIVANDAIQTLGTFLSSNGKRPWWVLWLYACSVLTVVIVYGWFAYQGDVSYGRLSTKFPVPEAFTIIHLIPPLAIIVLTRYGIPVSTTFLVLTVFAPSALASILTKSVLGYCLAFLVGYLVYRFVASQFEKRVLSSPVTPSTKWITLQWISTAFLWSQWLIQDLANIFVYMPTRKLSVEQLGAALILLLILHGVIFYRRGGEIQQIVTSKTGTTDIRSATIIDFIYALILLFFKKVSNIPMSTTWVFIGLLAGRELGMTLMLRQREMKSVRKVIFKDIGKAFIGLAVSVALALTLPMLSRYISF